MTDKQPSKKKQFEDFTRQAISDLVIEVVILQKNLLAIKRLAKFTDEQVEAEIKEIVKEIEERRTNSKEDGNRPTDKIQN